MKIKKKKENNRACLVLNIIFKKASEEIKKNLNMYLEF